jgi:monoamine oxidase
MADAEAIVAGAGLAGLVAARELTAAGRRVLVLEARDRVGGRTWTVPFDRAGVRVDLGAEWLSPRHHRALAAELARYGLRTAEPVGGAGDGNLAGQGGTGDAPMAAGEEREFAAALRRMEADARRIDFGRPDWHAGLADLDVPFASYLDRLPGSAAVRARLLARAFALMGADERRYSALTLLHEFAGFGSAAEAFDGESLRIADGAGAVAEAVAADLGAAVRLGEQVTAVEAGDGGCTLTTADGARYTCATVIMAVPVNTLQDIAFAPRPALPGPHVGQAAKVWLHAEGIAPGTTYSGWPGVVEAYAVPARDGVALAAFQLRSGSVSEQEAAVTRELEQAFPAASLTPGRWHDWCGDPFARGTWSVPAPGQLAQWHALASQAGPVFFAGGDISRRWLGWMDGAVTSGADTAHRVSAFLGGQPVPASRG